MTQIPLRCHLLIGPPGSGKTTMARDLAPLLQSESGEPALVLSTDAIRAELFGDASVQGPWALWDRVAGDRTAWAFFEHEDRAPVPMHLRLHG